MKFSINGNLPIMETLPLNVAKHLSVSKDFAKVNVKHVSRFLDHDVVIMAITYPQYIGSNTVASTREKECLGCFLEP